MCGTKMHSVPVLIYRETRTPPSYARCRSRDDLRPVQASPALCPSEPRQQPRVTKAVPYGAHSDTRSLSSSKSDPRFPQLFCVRNYNTRFNFYFQVKTNLILKYISNISDTPQEKETTAHPGDFARVWTGAGRRGARRSVSPFVHPSPHTQAQSSAETPQRVTSKSHPTRISTLTPRYCRHRHHSSVAHECICST